MDLIVNNIKIGIRIRFNYGIRSTTDSVSRVRVARLAFNEILILIHSCVWVDMSYICSVGESAGDLVVQGRVGSNRKPCMTRRWLFLFYLFFFLSPATCQL